MDYAYKNNQKDLIESSDHRTSRNMVGTLPLIATQEQMSSGWTIRSGIYEVLKPYIVLNQASSLQCNESEQLTETDTAPAFARYEGITAKQAGVLLELLPARALGDRQNNAPTLYQLLHACKNNPTTVELFGYYVGPSRGDERISVEGFIYYDQLHLDIRRFHDEECQCAPLWNDIKKQCRLEDNATPPDELCSINPSWNPERTGWRLWWD